MAQFIKIKNNIIATDEISNIEQTGCLVRINFKKPDGGYIYFDSEEKNEEEAVALLNSIAYALESV